MASALASGAGGLEPADWALASVLAPRAGDLVPAGWPPASLPVSGAEGVASEDWAPASLPASGAEGVASEDWAPASVLAFQAVVWIPWPAAGALAVALVAAVLAAPLVAAAPGASLPASRPCSSPGPTQRGQEVSARPAMEAISMGPFDLLSSDPSIPPDYPDACQAAARTESRKNARDPERPIIESGSAGSRAGRKRSVVLSDTWPGGMLRTAVVNRLARRRLNAGARIHICTAIKAN